MEQRLTFRAAQYAALGDPHRLAIIDALQAGDYTPSALATLTGLSSNLLAFHLNVLTDASLVRRVASEGDRRRRYVTLHEDAPMIGDTARDLTGPVLFVCTHNQARSQFAAALWQQHTGMPAFSAGAHPATEPDPTAVRVANQYGLQAKGWATSSYSDITVTPQQVITVCDRAFEAGVPFASPVSHWSIADPSGGPTSTYLRAVQRIERRITRLIHASQTAPS